MALADREVSLMVCLENSQCSLREGGLEWVWLFISKEWDRGCHNHGPGRVLCGGGGGRDCGQHLWVWKAGQLLRRGRG